MPKLPEATWRLSSNVKRHGRGDGIDTTKREVREMCSLNFILTALSSPFVQYRPRKVDNQEVTKKIFNFNTISFIKLSKTHEFVEINVNLVDNTVDCDFFLFAIIS